MRLIDILTITMKMYYAFFFVWSMYYTFKNILSVREKGFSKIFLHWIASVCCALPTLMLYYCFIHENIYNKWTIRDHKGHLSSFVKYNLILVKYFYSFGLDSTNHHNSARAPAFSVFSSGEKRRDKARYPYTKN